MGVYRHFPYSNFHNMNMDELIKAVKFLFEEYMRINELTDLTAQQLEELKEYVVNAFDSLELQEYVNNKFDEMIVDGTLPEILQRLIPPEVTLWLNRHITSGMIIDSSLTVAGAAADAQATGEALRFKANMPVENNEPVDGTDGQVLATNGDGTTRWVDFAEPTPEEITEAINNWLAEHPDATTTVQDKSLTADKFRDELKLLTLKDYVTPQMFGAVGDGVFDDTRAMQRALDSRKPVLLISNYKCGHIYGENVTILGNGKRINNKTNDVVFDCTETFRGSNFTINNVEQFDYLAADPIYGTIKSKHVDIDNIKFENINSAGVYATGNCIINNCVFDNTNFDVEQIYDGTLNNRSFGIYIPSYDCDKVMVTNCSFYSLIEGVYYGVYTGFTHEAVVTISNNVFDLIGDHAVYINSLEDLTTTLIEHNLCLHNATAFATSGNNVIVRDNMVLGAFTGDRQLFGCAIRDGGNVKYLNNVFISGEFETYSGSNTNFLITSLLTNTARDQIVFEHNIFEIEDTNPDASYFRIGYGQNANFRNIYFRNNTISIKGGKYGILCNVSGGLILEDNKIYFNQSSGFLTMGTAIVYVRRNYIDNLDSGAIFQMVCNGEYHYNKFNSNALPLRRATAAIYDIEENTNSNAIGVYNLINAEKTNIKYKSNIKGIVEVPSSGTGEIRDQNINPAFNNILLLFDSNGAPVSITITVYTTQRIAFTGAAEGTYTYVIL